MMTSLGSKWAAGKARGGRISKAIRNRSRSRGTAADPFSTQPSGPRPVGCFSALLARPVSIQIWALRSRLEKQPTDLRRNLRDFGDGALSNFSGNTNRPGRISRVYAQSRPVRASLAFRDLLIEVGGGHLFTLYDGF